MCKTKQNCGCGCSLKENKKTVNEVFGFSKEEKALKAKKQLFAKAEVEIDNYNFHNLFKQPAGQTSNDWKNADMLNLTTNTLKSAARSMPSVAQLQPELFTINSNSKTNAMGVIYNYQGKQLHGVVPLQFYFITNNSTIMDNKEIQNKFKAQLKRNIGLTESKNSLAKRLIEKLEKISGKKITLKEAWDQINDIYNRRHYSHVKDLDVPRPRYLPTIQAGKGGARYWDLYLQDLASDVMIDKYGLEKGYKIWEGSIGAGSRGGAMFMASDKIATEKLQMLRELQNKGIDVSADFKDYFNRSYLTVWKEWLREVKGIEPKEVISKPEVKVEPTPVVAPIISKPQSVAPIISKPTISKPSSSNLVNLEPDAKDEQRISDIMRRANGNVMKARQLAQQMANSIDDYSKVYRRYAAAENDNYHDLALIFYKRAMELK